MEPQQNDEANLVKYYTFEHHELERSFVGKCQSAISDYSFYIKVYHLLYFRIKYNGFFEFNDLLYSYADSAPNSTQTYKMLAINRKLDPSVSISKFLSNPIFRNIPCIHEFFCYSTFPSIFLSFISEESFSLGYKFIKNYFDEPKIMPLLVSSFLLHSMLFQDRLISNFLNRINKSKKKQASSELKLQAKYFYEFQIDEEELWKDKYGLELKKIKKKFYKALEECTSYLNYYQIKIIKDLQQKDKEKAIYVVSELFLKEIMKNLSKYHYISNDTNILSKNTSVLGPSNTLYIKRCNILSDIYDKLDFDIVVKIICDSKMCYEFSNINEMIINDGYKNAMSQADIKINSYLWLYSKLPEEKRSISLELIKFDELDNNEAETTKVSAIIYNYINYVKLYDQKDFANDISILYFKVSEHFNQNMPKTTHTFDEMKKSKEVRTYRKFLMKYSNHLNNLLLYSNSTIEILRSRLARFVEKVLLKEHSFDPYIYELNQFALFALPKNTNSPITKILKDATSNNNNVIEQPINFIEIAKKLDNDNIKNKNNDLPHYSRFIKIIEIASYFLYIHKMNNDNTLNNMADVFDFNTQINFSQSINQQNSDKTNNNHNENDNDNNNANDNDNADDNHNENENENNNANDNVNTNNNDIFIDNDYLKDQVKSAEEKIISLINNNTKDIADDCKIPQDYSDFFNFYDDIKYMISSTNDEIRNECLFMRNQFNIGQIIKTLVTIEKTIEKSIQKSIFESDKNIQPYIIYWIFHSTQDEKETIQFNTEYIYFKASIIKARQYLKKIQNDQKSKHIMLPSPLLEAQKSLEKLAEFCNMKLEITIPQ